LSFYIFAFNFCTSIKELTMPLLMCPNCHEGMKQINREGVQIDICPTCRGVWLDRGELEKILEMNRSEQESYEQPSAPAPVSAAPSPAPRPAYTAPPPQAPAPNYPPQPSYGNPSYGNQGYPPHSGHSHGHHGGGYHQPHYDKYGRPYKKKSKMEALFDIFD
jgi:Zn-finger nucleic acid-binding protein